MTQMYPIFTDGKKFYHMEEKSPKGCRFAYFSKLKLREWNKKEKPDLNGKKAKIIYDNWEKQVAKSGGKE